VRLKDINIYFKSLLENTMKRYEFKINLKQISKCTVGSTRISQLSELINNNKSIGLSAVESIAESANCDLYLCFISKDNARLRNEIELTNKNILNNLFSNIIRFWEGK